MSIASIETSTNHPNEAVKAIVDAPTKQFDGRNMMFRPQNNATDLQIDSPHCSCCCF
jgi:hypothetical protein